MQSKVYLGSSKLPTPTTISEHRFGSFLRTFYEFSYTNKETQESHIFRGSNIGHCLHGHDWFICCIPEQIAPEPTKLENNYQVGTTQTIEPEKPIVEIPTRGNPVSAESTDQSTDEMIPETKERKFPEIQTGLWRTESINQYQNEASIEREEGTKISSQLEGNLKLDDPEEFISSAPMYEFYMNKLLNHESTHKFNVELTLLLPGSKRPRKNPKPPRPPNAYIVYSLYRKQISTSFRKTSSARSGAQLHKDLGQDWRNLPVKDKEVFTILADFANHLHSLVYPNYKFQPSVPFRSKKRKE